MRKWWKVAIACFALSVCASAAVRFDESASDTLVLSSDRFRIVFDKRNGAIRSITDARAVREIITGSRDGCLWRATSETGIDIRSSAWGTPGAGTFAWSWSPDSRVLTFDYKPTSGGDSGASARVVISVPDERWLDMRIEMESTSQRPIDYVHFPAGLAFSEPEIERVLLPLIPGITLERSFFAENRSYTAKYPGEGMFADLVALVSSSGRLAIYALPDKPLQAATLGVEHDDAAAGDVAHYIHTFAVRLAPGARWISPTMRFRPGESLEDIARAFRADSGIATAPSLSEKLGALLPVVVAAPFLKLEMESLNRPFAEYPPLLRALPVPSILHFVGYQPRGFDENYPDFLPPSPAFGTTEEFAAIVREARAIGHVTMPYTNPTWWDDESPTMQTLPPPLTARDIAVRGDDGSPRYEMYGKHGGYAVSPNHPFVKQRLDDLLRQMREEIPFDMIFEDQIGARSWLFDSNPASPSPTAYLDEWLDHTRRYQTAKLATEQGYDRLVWTEVAFFGSVQDDEWTAARFGRGNWAEFPFTAIVARDKVLFYPHNMGANMPGKATFTTNAAMGQMTMTLLGDPSVFVLGADGGLEKDDVRIVSTFQRLVFARYATETAISFETLAPGVTRTRFPSATVIANRNESPCPWGRHVLAPGGFVVTSEAGNLEAGVFHGYDDTTLTAGDHWLVVVRDAAGITVRKPGGPSTQLAIAPLASWDGATPVEIRAVDRSGEMVRTVEFTRTPEGLLFSYERVIRDRIIDHYRIVDPRVEPRRRGVRR